MKIKYLKCEIPFIFQVYTGKHPRGPNKFTTLLWEYRVDGIALEFQKKSLPFWIVGYPTLKLAFVLLILTLERRADKPFSMQRAQSSIFYSLKRLNRGKILTSTGDWFPSHSTKSSILKHEQTTKGHLLKENKSIK